MDATHQHVDSADDLFESSWWREQMLDYDAKKCAEAAKRYCEAKQAARVAAGNLERSPIANEDAFLAEIAKANDMSLQARPVPEDLVKRHAEALNLRQKAEDEDAKAKDALKESKKMFDAEMSLLRSKV